MNYRNSFNRAKRVIEARGADPETAVGTEQSVATELVGLETVARDSEVRALTYPQHGYLSPMAATEAFAIELQRRLSQLASNLNLKSPPPGKYNPLIATPTLSREVWRARQVVDELSIPYGFYVEYAVLHWYELGNTRMPRPSQLTSFGMAMHVMQLWADPAFRYNYPLFAGWDARFDADKYRGEDFQHRAIELIEQRIGDAAATGRDPATVLVDYLDVNISEEEAERRFGQELVDKALAMEAVAVATHVDAVGIPDNGINAFLQNM